jgi:hypothetical protein
MQEDRFLRRKWTLQAHGEKVIFIKSSGERGEHVVMKILLWALYLPQYPDMSVEIRIGDRYKPDVVALNAENEPLFWGEAGMVGKDKIEKLVKRYRNTHFAMSKWNTNLDPYIEMVEQAVSGIQRAAPFDLLRFAPDSVERFITDTGEVHVTHDDLEWVRIGPDIPHDVASGN